jgi:CRP/FNR family transcriptional regulator
MHKQTTIESSVEHNALPSAGETDDVNDDCAILDSIRDTNSRRLKYFSAGDIIHRKGDRVDRVYVVRSGIVKLVSYLPNGRSRIIRLLNGNRWIGLEGLISRPYEHTAIAVGDVEMNYVPINNLKHLEREDPRRFNRVLKLVYTYLTQADMWIADFSTGGIKPRVARLLFFLSDIEYGESSSRIDLLTVHEMADMLGVTQESVSRILADFKRNGMLHKQTGPTDETYEINRHNMHHEAEQ